MSSIYHSLAVGRPHTGHTASFEVCSLCQRSHPETKLGYLANVLSDVELWRGILSERTKDISLHTLIINTGVIKLQNLISFAEKDNVYIYYPKDREN